MSLLGHWSWGCVYTASRTWTTSLTLGSWTLAGRTQIGQRGVPEQGLCWRWEQKKNIFRGSPCCLRWCQKEIFLFKQMMQPTYPTIWMEITLSQKCCGILFMLRSGYLGELILPFICILNNAGQIPAPIHQVILSGSCLIMGKNKSDSAVPIKTFLLDCNSYILKWFLKSEPRHTI